jgi:hypothetical protein
VDKLLLLGSTFTIYLPYSPVTLIRPRPLRPSHPGHGERVPLIDDEAPVRPATAEVLSRLGYVAVSFSDSHARAIRRRGPRLSSQFAAPTGGKVDLTRSEDASAFGDLLTRHARYLRRCGRTKILTCAGEMEDMPAALIPPVPMWSENYAFMVNDAAQRGA